jgi:hypothetical protein
MSASRVALALVILFLGAGCGGGNETSTSSTETTTTTSATPAQMTAVKAYFLRDGRVWPVGRDVKRTTEVAAAALRQLLAGPTGREGTDLQATTAIPEGTELDDVSIDANIATVRFSADLPRKALAQVVYTLTQFPGVTSVTLAGNTHKRADFEDVTPAILIESPLPFEDVTSPLHASGSANTLGATFNYRLKDPEKRIVAHDFVPGTSGSGARGTFDFTTAPFGVPSDGVGELIVFERSTENGKRIHLVEIPLRMKKSG